MGVSLSPNGAQTRGVLWDVIAPWVRWPVHSPRRLFTVLAGNVILVVLWHVAPEAAPTTESSATATPAVSSASAAPSPSATAGQAPVVSPCAQVTSGGHPDTSSSVAASGLTGATMAADGGPTDPILPAGSAEAAQAFVTAWARPELPAGQWLAGVRGYLAPELERSMSYTDPSQIDATKVTGPARMIRVLPDGTAASFEVPTDAGATLVELALVKGRWLATDIVPASAAAPGD